MHLEVEMKKSAVIMIVMILILLTACFQEKLTNPETELPNEISFSELKGYYTTDDYTDFGLWLLTINVEVLSEKIAGAADYSLETGSGRYELMQNPLNKEQLMAFLPENYKIETLSKAIITVDKRIKEVYRQNNADISIASVYIIKEGKEYELTMKDYLFMKQAPDEFVYKTGELLRPAYLKSSDGYAYDLKHYYDARQVSSDHEVNEAFSFLKNLENHEDYIYTGNPNWVKIVGESVVICAPDTRDRVWQLGKMGSIDETATYTYDITDDDAVQTLTLTIKDDNLPVKYYKSGDYKIQFGRDATVCSLVNMSGNLYACIIDYTTTGNPDRVKNARFIEILPSTQTEIRIKPEGNRYAKLVTAAATVLKVSYGTSVLQLKESLEAVDESGQTYIFNTVDWELTAAATLTKDGTLTVISEYGEPYKTDFEMLINPTPFVRLETMANNSGTRDGEELILFWHDTISDAVAGAMESGQSTITVWLGRYSENIDFNSKSIILKSTYEIDENAIGTTIIDGNGQGSAITINAIQPNSEREDTVTMIAGFTITGGGTNTGISSAGILVNGKAVEIKDNIITRNGTQTGDMDGYGIYLNDSDARICDNRITSNWNGDENGAGISVNGNSNPVIEKNYIAYNISGENGGGIALSDGSTVQLYANAFSENEAVKGNCVYVAQNATPTNKAGTEWRRFNVPNATVSFVEHNTNSEDDNYYLTGSAVSEGSFIYFDGHVRTLEGELTVSPATLTGEGSVTLSLTYIFDCETSKGVVTFSLPEGATITTGATITIDGTERPAKSEEISADGTQVCLNIGTGNTQREITLTYAATPTYALHSFEAVLDADGVDGVHMPSDPATGTFDYFSDFTLDINGEEQRYKTFSEAFDAIGAGESGVIHVNESVTVFLSSAFEVKDSREVTVQPVEGASVTFDARDNCRQFVVENGTLKLSNTVLKNGNTTGMVLSQPSDENNGGGIYLYIATLTLEGCRLIDNFAEEDGGAVYANQSTVNMTDSIVDSNQSKHSGGGIYSYSSTIDLTQSTITSNVAGQDGGGIFITASSNVNLNTVTVSSNRVGNYGGGICKGNSSIYTNGNQWRFDDQNTAFCVLTVKDNVTGGASFTTDLTHSDRSVIVQNNTGNASREYYSN
jgi:predicted outer membrane repeat protein